MNYNPLAPINPERLRPEVVLSLLKEPEIKPEVTDFTLEDKATHYLITGFREGDSLVSYKLFKELLQKQTQDNHAQHALSVSKEEPHLEDISLYYTIFNAFFNNKDSKYKDIIEQARQFIKQSMLKNWLSTLTRIRYNPDGDDIIIHNYKQPDQYLINMDYFTGPDGYITKPETTNIIKPLQSLLNTSQSPEQINQVYKWLTDVDAYIHRLNSRPEETTEKVAGLVAGFVRAGLSCFGDPGVLDSGFGVAKIFHRK